MELVESIVLCAGAYVLGSIPAAYIFARWRKGIDIRNYGSGTVSGSMIWEHVSRVGIVVVGLFDVGKAALPSWLGLQISPTVAVIAGLMATIGHNWPVFLRWTGGRGIGCFMGLLLVIFPWGFPWLLSFLALGRLVSRDSAPWALAGLAALPGFAALCGGSTHVILACVGFLLITIVKRLEANGRMLPTLRHEQRRVLLYRLFLDRDIRDWKTWVSRQGGAPPTREPQAGFPIR